MKNIAAIRGNNLSYLSKATKRGTVQDSIPVTLRLAAVIAARSGILVVKTLKPQCGRYHGYSLGSCLGCELEHAVDGEFEFAVMNQF
jgi:hypothetical protein